MKAKRTLVLIIGVITLCFGCKKYPQNTLWFKSPEKAFKGGRITSFLVNGADSLDYLSSLCGFDIRNEIFTYHPDWMGLKSEHISGSLRFGRKKKEDIPPKFCGVGMNFFPDKSHYIINPLTPPYLPFQPFGTWKILKLTRTGTLKLEIIKNNKKYEVQFN